MRVIDKIDKYIENIENRCEKILESRRKVGGPEYDKFFTKMLKKWKINSYKDLPVDKQKKFFDEVDRKWNSKKEKGNDGEED